jgi:acyl-CoA synthetase (AMP-forming)/AMP-acid ligase II
VRGEVETLVDVLRMRVRLTPTARFVVFGDVSCTYEELWSGAAAAGGELHDQGVAPGDRVLIAMPNGLEFFFAFFGTVLCGATSVPVFPTLDPSRLLSLARLCGARVIVVPAYGAPDNLAALRVAANERAYAVVTPTGRSHVRDETFPRVLPGDAAYIQYTSGSTGNPKGVVLSHDNLLTNMQQMLDAMSITGNDRFVTWLPTYHDMGLTLMALTPIFAGAPVVLLPASLRAVRTWVQAIQDHGGTFTAAPDFGYRFCLRQVRDPGEFDLSTLRVAMDAAEPVRSRTIEQFEAAFGLQRVMMTGYGLAEATLSVTCTAPAGEIRVDESGLVSLGRPLPGIEVLIVNGDTILPAGAVGEIVVGSPANTRGYHRNPDETRRLFWGPRAIRTGDLGYVDKHGNLFFVARKKNVIKLAGRTLYPQEVEEIVDDLSGVRRSAAVGIDRGRMEGEQLYVFAEVRSRLVSRPLELREVALATVRALHSTLGVRPARTYLLKPKGIPFTPNGKIQHGLLRDKYLAGTLRDEGTVVFPAEESSGAA